ncbi:hypothetical protein GF382_02605 [Candidatus Falkowbacteria bacterium]|nr:hypothetical protein [Candidatus Falkowbacteria bacterium]
MRRKKSNIIIRILFNPKTFALGLLAVFIAISIPISKNISKKYTIDQEILDLESEISKLESSNKNLKKIINYLESDQFVEEQARLSLGLKKPGEEVVVVDTKGYVAGVSSQVKDRQEEVGDLSNPQLWWRFFFQSKKGL